MISRKTKQVFISFLAITALSLFVVTVTALADMRFDFKAYLQPEDMRAILSQLFPEGTERTYVEEKLVKEGGAIIKPHETRPNVFHYQYEFPALSWDSSTQRTVTVMYYADDTVRQIWTTQIGTVLPITSPRDRSDAGVFRFEDYNDPADLVQILRALFPLDTPRAEVEKVLVKWAQASILHPVNEPHSTTYTRRFDAYIPTEDGRTVPEEHVWNVTARYNKDDTLSQILVDGSAVQKAHTHSREYFLSKMKKKETK